MTLKMTPEEQAFQDHAMVQAYLNGAISAIQQAKAKYQALARDDSELVAIEAAIEDELDVVTADKVQRPSPEL